MEAPGLGLSTFCGAFVGSKRVRLEIDSSVDGDLSHSRIGTGWILRRLVVATGLADTATPQGESRSANPGDDKTVRDHHATRERCAFREAGHILSFEHRPKALGDEVEVGHFDVRELQHGVADRRLVLVDCLLYSEKEMAE